jgi:hypothetical protein
MNKIFFITIILIFLAATCHKEENGSIELHFTHTVDGNPVQLNELIYTNAAGNTYQVNEVKYFISKIILIDTEGKPVAVAQGGGIHYVDVSLAKTLNWKIDKLPPKSYTAISFVFGLDEQDNKSNRFVNPPECNLAWPDELGGGYHYMQINGKFVNKVGITKNMNIHTGIGQLYNENKEITQFIHNYFTINLPVKFSVHKYATTHLVLNMEIQRWFDTPNLYNFDDFGTGIMQNQQAQELLKENGWNVFDVKM